MDIATSQGSAESSECQYRPRATRYEPSHNDACLAWRERSLESQTDAANPENRRLFALLLDISQTGASVALDRVPQPADGVKLRIEGNQVDDWTEAEVVGVTTSPHGPHLIRLEFRTPCPFETLRAAICD